MLRTLLVGLDGSAESDAAAVWAIATAKKNDALVIGLGIVDEPGISESEATPLGMDFLKEQRDQHLIRQARVHVEQALERFTLACTRAAVSHKLLEDVGEPAATILKVLQRYDLLVLGARTHFSGGDWESADDTLAVVLKSSPRPVVRVADPSTRASAGRDAVLVAYDGSLHAARALQMLVLLNLGGEATVHILSVAEEHAEASRIAERAADFLGHHCRAARVHAIASTAGPAEIIRTHVDTLAADLVVMGALGTTGLRQLFFGSVTKSLLQDTSISLFLSQ